MPWAISLRQCITIPACDRVVDVAEIGDAGQQDAEDEDDAGQRALGIVDGERCENGDAVRDRLHAGLAVQPLAKAYGGRA